MAANLASNDFSPYNTIGVAVVSFEHFGDPVPILDGQPIDTSALLSPNRHVVVLPPPPQGLLPDQTHNSDNYVASVERWEANTDLSDLGIPNFFDGKVVQTQQHTWVE
jgi:hypothetical protein